MPHAQSLIITFDPRSATEPNCDYLMFSRVAIGGDELGFFTGDVCWKDILKRKRENRMIIIIYVFFWLFLFDIYFIIAVPFAAFSDHWREVHLVFLLWLCWYVFLYIKKIILLKLTHFFFFRTLLGIQIHCHTTIFWRNNTWNGSSMWSWLRVSHVWIN